MSQIDKSMFFKKSDYELKELYRIGKKISNGDFGEIRKCILKDQGLVRCLKVLNKEKMNEKDIQEFYQELKIVSKLDHPNIIQHYELFEEELRFYVVQEICPQGDLYSELERRKKFEEKDASFVIKQILNAVFYMQKMNIVHRDLKLENICLQSQNGLDIVKIIDFGSATNIQNNEYLTQKIGSPYYIAPEVLLKNYKFKCDIWSVGVITYMLLSGQPPFNGKNYANILEKVKTGEFNFDNPVWETISDDAKDFISKLLTYDQVTRPNAELALVHPWIQTYNQNSADLIEKQNALNNLKNYNPGSQFKTAVFSFISTQLLSKEEKENLGRVFKSFDINGDGQLSMEEIKNGYQDFYGINMSDEEIQKMFDLVDTDQSGYIDYSEFIQAATHQKQLTSNYQLITAFKMIDKDNSGWIDLEEIKKCFSFSQIISQEDAEQLLEHAKIQKGKICLDDFVKMMKSVQEL